MVARFLRLVAVSAIGALITVGVFGVYPKTHCTYSTLRCIDAAPGGGQQVFCGSRSECEGVFVYCESADSNLNEMCIIQSTNPECEDVNTGPMTCGEKWRALCVPDALGHCLYGPLTDMEEECETVSCGDT